MLNKIGVMEAFISLGKCNDFQSDNSFIVLIIVIFM